MFDQVVQAIYEWRCNNNGALPGRIVFATPLSYQEFCHTMKISGLHKMSYIPVTAFMDVVIEVDNQQTDIRSFQLL
jgi:hypothetical protein